MNTSKHNNQGDEMQDDYVSEPMAHSHVYHNGKAFYVSTINRNSSAGYGGVYSETLVWEWNKETRQRGDLIGQDEHCKDSIFAHQRMVQRLFDTGSCAEIEKE